MFFETKFANFNFLLGRKRLDSCNLKTSLISRTLHHIKSYCDVTIQFALFRGTDQLSFSCEKQKVSI